MHKSHLTSFAFAEQQAVRAMGETKSPLTLAGRGGGGNTQDGFPELMENDAIVAQPQVPGT